MIENFEIFQTIAATIGLVFLIWGSALYIKYRNEDQDNISQDEIDRIKRSATIKVKIAITIFVAIYVCRLIIGSLIAGGKLV